MQPSKSSYEKKIGITIVLGISALLGIASVQYRTVTEAANRASWVDHTERVLVTLEETLRAAAWVQNAARGYVITGDLAMLAPREAAIAELHENLRRLRELTADNPRQQKRLDTLDPIVVQLLAVQKNLADERNNPGYSGVRAAALVEGGSRLADEMKRAIGEMRNEENQLLLGRAKRANRVAPASIALVCLSLLAIFVAYGLVVTQVRGLAGRNGSSGRFWRPLPTQ